MTFFEEVREILKQHDPGKIYLAMRIAKKYKTPKEQKKAIDGLKQIYEAGGPGKIDFKELFSSAPIPEKPKVVESNHNNDDFDLDSLDDSKIEVDSEEDFTKED